jgi:hypothetical protein
MRFRGAIDRQAEICKGVDHGRQSLFALTQPSFHSASA